MENTPVDHPTYIQAVEYIRECSLQYLLVAVFASYELFRLNSKNCRVMATVVYLVCIAVASFAVLPPPAVPQGVNATLPLTYPGRVLQGDGSQTCHSEEQ